MKLVMCALAAVAAAASASAAQEGYGLTPVGYVPLRCIHALPEGASVVEPEGAPHFHFRHRDGSLSEPIKRCVGSGIAPRRQAEPAMMDEGDGWQAYVKQKIGDNSTDKFITKFNGRWTVPPVPSEQAQTLFSFTGLQNIDWVPPQPQPFASFDIIQPVLQYGASAAGEFEGAYSIASWYVTLGTDVIYSTLKKVPASGTIYGIMTRTPGKDDSWFISTQHVESNTTSAVTVERPILKSQPWAYVTLEVYDVDDCAQYPPSGSVSSFTELDIAVNGEAFTPTWQTGTDGQNPPVCGSSIKVNSPTAVDIVY